MDNAIEDPVFDSEMLKRGTVHAQFGPDLHFCAGLHFEFERWRVSQCGRLRLYQSPSKTFMDDLITLAQTITC